MMDHNDVITTLKQGALAEWKTSSDPIKLGTAAWKPDFVLDQNVAVLLLGGNIPGFLERRMRAAKEHGLRIHCICSIATLSSTESLLLLSDLDAEVLLHGEGAASNEFLPLLKALAVEQIPVEALARSTLVRNGLARCKEAQTNALKGRTLEWLLHFMLEQVADFRVVRCNYSTTNEELDVLVQLRTLNAAYCWAHKAAPFIAVEAKNRGDRQGQEVVSKLHSVVLTKGGNCRIGVLVSLSGFTSGAHEQRLKLSLSEVTLLLLDGEALQEWADAADYEGKLNDLVTEAMLP